MPDDSARAHTVGTHRGRECDLHGEDRRLHPVDPGHSLGCRHRLGDREPGLGGDQRLELCHPCGKSGFDGKQLRAHGGPLGSLTGEHPHRSAIVLSDRRRKRNLTGGDPAQCVGQLRQGGREHTRAHRPVSTPTRQCVRQVGCRQPFRMLLDPVGEPQRGPSQLLVGGGGHREQRRPASGGGGLIGFRGDRRLLEHGVHVRSGHPERRHRSAARLVARSRPRRDLLGDEQSRLDLTEFVGQPSEMRHRRHQAGLQPEDRLDESDGAGGGLGMAEIAFGRTDDAPVSAHAVDLRQPTEFERVTDRCAGAVGLDHANGCRVHPRHRQGCAVDVGLGVQRWCGDRR